MVIAGRFPDVDSEPSQTSLTELLPARLKLARLSSKHAQKVFCSLAREELALTVEVDLPPKALIVLSSCQMHKESLSWK